MPTYDFTLYVRIDDEHALLTAARTRAIEDGDTTDHLVEDDGHVDVTACLVTLLDPGTLAGCSIIDSGADRVSDQLGDQHGS